MNENKTFCAYCGELHDTDTLTETSIGLVCEDCLSSHFSSCEHCGEYFPTDDDELEPVHTSWRSYTTEHWCSNCRDTYAYQCEDCEEWFTDDYCGTLDEGYTLCSGCYENYRHCEDCGSLVREDNGFWDDDDNFYCSSCYRAGRDSIHPYGYKPEPDFGLRRGESLDTALTFGVENEVDKGEDRYATAKAVTEAGKGRVYCKSDGSLDDGFEIVSHPSTLNHHLYEVSWRAILRTAEKAGFKSHDTETCGLHIHIGRLGLGANGDERRLNAYKLVILANTLRLPLATFSRRKQNHLDHWATLPDFGNCVGLADDELLSIARGYASFGRYRAVNLRNSSTVEIRIFRGTLKRDTLIASLQLVHNLCVYAKTHTLQECASCSFADILSIQRFSELMEYSISKGLAVAPTEAA